jgi:hypothetical protein
MTDPGEDERERLRQRWNRREAQIADIHEGKAVNGDRAAPINEHHDIEPSGLATSRNCATIRTEHYPTRIEELAI